VPTCLREAEALLRRRQANCAKWPEAVAPGPVWTLLNPADRDAEAVSKFGSETPMKRPAQPEEIAPAFVFLAAPSCSSYITGEILPIIGGYTGG
jgi:NAD(P)-dependent dehydrogenase (short-subunit alcohol dehydrogenase family)